MTKIKRVNLPEDKKNNKKKTVNNNTKKIKVINFLWKMAERKWQQPKIHRNEEKKHERKKK